MVLNYLSRAYLKILPSKDFNSKSLSYKLMLANNLIYSTGIAFLFESRFLDKGIFALLPVGQRILDKLVKIIESEFAEIGAQKLELPVLGSKTLWTKSQRWDEMSIEMFKLKDRWESEFCLQPTAEEMVTDIVKNFGLLKAKHYPLLLYQLSQKFRDEYSPRFGMLRGRQFLMNDLYSFDPNEENAKETYKSVNNVYKRIFREHLSLEPFIVEANPGAMGGTLSHEYQLPSSSAEDKVDICQECRSVQKYEPESDNRVCQICSSHAAFKSISTVEVAHTFQLGEKYSKSFGALTVDKRPYYMCCFGIGLTRLIPASIDVLTTSDNAMRLPRSISPFKLAVILPSSETHPNVGYVNSFIRDLDQIVCLKNEILIDDRLDKSIGRKLAEMNQLGIYHILVAPGQKHVDFCDSPKMEYFRDELIPEGLLSHRQIFELAHTL